MTLNPAWQHFLQTQGMSAAQDFGDPQAEREAAWQQSVCVELGAYGLLEVRGEDALAFLQGQFTNDVRAVDAEHAQLNAWCSAKGRIITNFRVLQRDGGYYLLLAADLLEAVLKRLSMYVLRSKVTLRDASDELACCGLAGSQAEATLNALGITPPTMDYASLTQHGVSVVQVGTQRFIVLAPAPELEKVWLQAQAQGCQACGFHAWQLLEIQAGVAWIDSTLSEAFTPQMINYELLGGVSFNKGCYTGQEVVARTHYLGKAKRRMQLLRWNGEALKVGADLPADAESLGQVVNVQPHPSGGYLLLAVLKEGSLPLAAQTVPLPYPVPA